MMNGVTARGNEGVGAAAMGAVAALGALGGPVGHLGDDTVKRGVERGGGPMKKDDFEKQLWKIIDLIEGIL